MEPLIKTHTHFNLTFSLNSPLEKCRNFEMTTFHSMGYTSLKDLMPASPPCAVSPTGSWKEGWREIPIRDPLLQHAAWAYLQPMAEARGGDGGGALFFKGLKNGCRGLLGCIAGVVLVVLGGWFCDRPAAAECGGDKFD